LKRRADSSANRTPLGGETVGRTTLYHRVIQARPKRPCRTISANGAWHRSRELCTKSGSAWWASASCMRPASSSRSPPTLPACGG
jgi:hypothetical protein